MAKEQEPMPRMLSRSAASRRAARSLIAPALATAFSTVALAQPDNPAMKELPEGTKPPAESTAPPTDPSTGNEKPGEPLTEQLKKGEGVLEPPRGMDPGIEKQPPFPDPGTTPVLPPPGEPGGDPNVQPR